MLMPHLVRLFLYKIFSDMQKRTLFRIAQKGIALKSLSKILDVILLDYYREVKK